MSDATLMLEFMGGPLPLPEHTLFMHGKAAPRTVSTTPTTLELVQSVSGVGSSIEFTNSCNLHDQKPGNVNSKLFHGAVTQHDIITITAQHVPAKYGLAIEIWINGAHVKRIAACCPSFFVPGTYIANGIFRVVNRSGGLPCYKCIGRPSTAYDLVDQAQSPARSRKIM